MSRNLRVAFPLPTWGQACGIAEYTASLARALTRAGITVVNTPDAETDLIHIQHEYSFYPTPQSLADACTGWRSQAPIVLTLHSVVHTPSDWRVCEQYVERVIVHAQAARALLETTIPVTVIPMGTGAPHPVDTQAVDTRKAALGLAGAWPVVGSFGFLRSQKGYLELLAAAQRLRPFYPELAVLLVAPKHNTGDEFEQDFLRQVYRLDWQERIHLVRTWQSPDDVLRTLQCADLLVLNYIPTPIGGGMSAAAKTCLQTGRPVLVSDTMHFWDLDDAVIRIPSPSPEQVERTIRAVLESSTQRQLAVDAAYQWCITHTWDQVADRHRQLYEEVLQTCLAS